MSSPLKQNTATIQELLNTINSLPEAGGVELPELSDEGSAAELFAGKELIDGNGEKVTGTFTIDSELSTQDNLISQIQTALQNKASASEPVLQTKTVTPTTSAQTVTPDSGYDGLSKVTVNAIPSTYVKPTATKAATTYTPTTSNQTIAAGTYCSGVQTIKGDANLIPANILGGKSIFGVSGGIETFDGSYECSGDSTGGSSGSSGASVETCTVKIYAPHGGYSVCYTTAETGSVHSAIQGNIFGGSWATFTNVVSGSVVSVISAGRTGNNSVETDKATLLHVDTQFTNHDYWFEINAMTGETATIYIPPSGSSGGSN